MEDMCTLLVNGHNSFVKLVGQFFDVFLLLYMRLNNYRELNKITLHLSEDAEAWKIFVSRLFNLYISIDAHRTHDSWF